MSYNRQLKHMGRTFWCRAYILKEVRSDKKNIPYDTLFTTDCPGLQTAQCSLT